MSTQIPRCVASELPPEILEHILDLSNAGRIRTLAAVDAAARGPRNEIWLRTSQVCKAWAAASQYLLTRDICAGSRTTPGLKNKGEVSCLAELVQVLATLPDRKHVRSAQIELGNGWTIDTTRPVTFHANRYNGGLGISWGQRQRLRWVKLAWGKADLLPRLFQLCDNLQHLSLTFADPVISADNHIGHSNITLLLPIHMWIGTAPLTNLRALSFTYATESSSAQAGQTVWLLAQILALTPHIAALNVDTYFGVDSDEHPDVARAAPVNLDALEELYIRGFAPSFLFLSNMPRLDRLVWHSPDYRQVDLIPTSVRILAINGDRHPTRPSFARLTRLQHVLVNGSDLWDGSSFHNNQYRAMGQESKGYYLRVVLGRLPPGLDSFTLVESFALRLVERDTLCSALMRWAESDARALPRKFTLLHQAGPLPAHYVHKEYAFEPLHTCPEFRAVQSLLVEKGVEVILGDTDDQFATLRFPSPPGP
ncbi:hypothetical protein EXIGLDRAFT_779849 [Exidia glandulosa HHB12029]|uniref:F-box domain-containing protein n=1 Tax=Exidia glandulosa HHB12029 TaxID=1314781 RepID=A0A165BVN9_EXIGL|nr:hypothetical protein EXIGLDRAFT_779849 [Exidia glandulosa HHB12029]